MLHQPSQNKSTPIKQLSQREYDEKRRNNQCFFCNEKYVPGHKCTTNKLYILLCPEVQEESLDGDTSTDLEQHETTNENSDNVAVSIHALLGSYGLHTLQVHGIIKKQPVVMLVDSGSTHNFIDVSLAKRLGVKMIPIKLMEVVVADGFKIPVEYVCKEVKWVVQGVQFCSDFLSMLIGGCCMLSLEFMWENKLVKLKGYQRYKANNQSTRKDIETWSDEQSYLLKSKEGCTQLWSINLGTTAFSNLEDPKGLELQALLSSFEDVFGMPKGLPPKRNLDHSITLQQGSNSINLRAYKYGSLQKNIIEDLVQEMLNNGVIRPSQSEFASPNNLMGVKKYYLEDDMLLRKGRLVVGDDKDLRRELIDFFHPSGLGGHIGFHATTQRLARTDYWKGMQA
ncbi:transposable element [Tanacetum coccineum]